MEKLFRWTYTAIVTPFTEDDKIDWEAFEKIVDKQIDWWVTWIVFVWTTWEGPTLSPKEHIEVLAWSTKYVNWRCQVIHWTWSNCTREAIEYSMQAMKSKADWIMVVNPYYNKPTQEWMYKHFTKIAHTVNMPMIVYNIKWRTWVNVETPTLLRLAQHKNIVWVKEASWDIDQMMDVINETPEDFCVLSWDDGITLPIIALWWDWIISVASNYIPKNMSTYVNYCLDWKFDKARELHYKLLNVFRAWFIETNPIPAKEILWMLWYIEPNLRLPMTRWSGETMERLNRVIKYIQEIEQ